MDVAASLYCNATIYTMDDQTPICEAMLVRDGRVVALGTNQDLRSAHPEVRRIDLEGQTVFPGFNDCHCHVLGLGLGLDDVSLEPPGVRSIRDIRDRIAVRASQSPTDEWIIGAGYDQNMLAERRHPTRDDLDDVSGGHPVVLRHTSTHVLTCNSRALELAGVRPDSTLSFVGEIVLDERGRPTGVLKEGARRLIEDAIPEPSDEQSCRAVLRAASHMAPFGITSATDLMTGQADSLDREVDAYRRAVRSGECRLRLGLSPQITYLAPPDGDDCVDPTDFTASEDQDWLRIRTAKVFTDGALSTRTAAMREPYAGGDGEAGMLLWDTVTLRNMMSRAHRAGWQIAAHALGDRAVEETLNAYEEILREHPRGRRRHRIEHCMVVDDQLAARMKGLGVMPVVQPDIFRLGDGYLASLGRERAGEVIPLRTFAAAGLSPAFSSDAPVVPCDPLLGIRSAMERQAPSGEVLGTAHAISFMEGVRHYTLDSAFVTFAETRTGRLAPGMMADFVVLAGLPKSLQDREILATPRESIRVTMTVVGGMTSFEA